MCIFIQEVAVGFQPRPICGQSRIREKMVSLFPKEETLEGPRTPHRGETSVGNWNCTLVNSVLQLLMRKKSTLRDPAWSQGTSELLRFLGRKPGEKAESGRSEIQSQLVISSSVALDESLTLFELQFPQR